MTYFLVSSNVSKDLLSTSNVSKSVKLILSQAIVFTSQNLVPVSILIKLRFWNIFSNRNTCRYNRTLNSLSFLSLKKFYGVWFQKRLSLKISSCSDFSSYSLVYSFGYIFFGYPYPLTTIIFVLDGILS